MPPCLLEETNKRELIENTRNTLRCQPLKPKNAKADSCRSAKFNRGVLHHIASLQVR
jgi:hypothetical protein